MSSSNTSEFFTKDHVKELQDALGASKYVIEGKVDVPKDQLALYFRNPASKEVRVIDFPQTSTTSLSPLLEACSPAAFGRGNKDILDPSYRKALKLNAMDFAINFSPERLGIMKEIKAKLGNSLSGDHSNPEPIYAELYKLNCYTEGDFFKAHKDTPRDDNMLGSLVVNLPAVHSGGELVIRGSDGTEHVCNWSQNEPTTVCSWAAFYSDMEHEIYPVTSGQRITLTYNLYFRETEDETTTIATNELKEHTFYTTLERLVNSDPSFMPSGGVIIAYLSHQYPTYCVDVCGEQPSRVIKYLKGNDNFLFQIAQSLGLAPRAKALVESNTILGDSNFTLMSNPAGLRNKLGIEMRDDEMETLLRELMSPADGDFQNDVESPGDVWSSRVMFLNNKLKAGTNWKEEYISYGNEASMGYLYATGVLAMHVMPWGVDENRRVGWDAVNEELGRKRARSFGYYPDQWLEEKTEQPDKWGSRLNP